jgi:uncharacterized protein YndB with AHSA1/START domain
MTRPTYRQPDPRLDLVLERLIDVQLELVWSAWTTPEHVKKWFAPAPWKMVDCEIDLRPGGIFRSVLRSPEGQDYPNIGCYLEIIPNEKLVWTDALEPGYRPSQNPFFTAVITFEKQGKSTKYTAIAIHKDERDRKKHEEMGFHAGWSQCLDQMVALIKQQSSS